ncbi:VOC family protein [Micromonospora sp. KC606]|uniref:VOC family protein n=1 Tax=Micromonospora sp. KC606 TaxID=2530379 RepID=UPI001FB7C851|nr:VOC family protein [Micromonospora sp. KC606]
MGAGRSALNLGTLHHVEVWVPDLALATASWGWLLGELGWTRPETPLAGTPVLGVPASVRSWVSCSSTG